MTIINSKNKMTSRFADDTISKVPQILRYQKCNFDMEGLTSISKIVSGLLSDSLVPCRRESASQHPVSFIHATDIFSRKFLQCWAPVDIQKFQTPDIQFQGRPVFAAQWCGYGHLIFKRQVVRRCGICPGRSCTGDGMQLHRCSWTFQIRDITSNVR